MVFCRVMGMKDEPEEVDAREGVCSNDTAIPGTAYRTRRPMLNPFGMRLKRTPSDAPNGDG
jgi:hypothetical protein